MTGALFSPAWYRVADLRLRLRRHTAVHRHSYRGRIWFVLQDRVTGQFHRFTPEAYELIGRMDGHRSLQEIWDAACTKLGDLMPTQQEVIDLLSQLHQANVIQSDRAADIGELHGRHSKIERDKLIQKLMSPFGLRLPLLDPERFLVATEKYVAPVFSWVGFAAWATTVVVALALAFVHGADLFHNISDHILAVQNVILMALVYPVVKTLHELGHAYAVKRWGGEVHEIGVMFLIFYPVPYTDASAATSFRDKWQRMVVGSAGIMVEMFLAAIALFVWLNVEPGLVRAVCANVILMSGVSTLLFNGNPLLRFDAYYVLSDLLEIPNLSQKSNQEVAYLAKRYLFGIRQITSPAWSKQEGFWLAAYAILAFVYRLFVLLAVSLLVTSRYLFIGGFVACWSIYMTLLNPVLKALRAPLRDGRMKAVKGRIYAISGGGVLAVLALLFLVPAPYSTRAQGLVWVEDKAIVRAGDAGFMQTVVSPPGSHVDEGQVLVKFDNPETTARVPVLAAELVQAEQGAQAVFDNPGQTLIQTSNVQFLQKQLATARERDAGLTVRSTVGGAFLLPDADDIVGKYFHRGERIGFVADPKHMLVVLLLPEDTIDAVRNRHSRVFLRFVTERGRQVEGRILRITPASDDTLPSAVMSAEGGGPFAPDPRAHDPLQAYQRFYRVDVAVPEVGAHPVEERVYGLFRHDWEPVGYRWSRSLRQLLLGRLNI
jgi:putative peptide zinc metalloprotease protein